MTLRTPRRRISPRTRKRYRAIKNFFKRAIGGSSQADIDINSSTAINVTDLKEKIVGLEQQLSEVNRTCREFIYLDGSRRGSQNIISSLHKDSIRRDDSAREPQRVETKILYKTSENNYINSEGSDCTPKHQQTNDEIPNDNINGCDTKATKKIKYKSSCRAKDSDMDPLLKHKTQSAYEYVGQACSSSSFHSLSEVKKVRHQTNPGYSGDHTERRARKTGRNIHDHQKEETYLEQIKRPMPKYYEGHREDRLVKHSKNRKSKRRNEVDQDFIADIIKRQYKPVQMFGRKVSDISQISEPLCRDREFTINENIQEGTELCSCCYGGQHSPKHHRHSDNSDARSVCDARLYSDKRNPRSKYRRMHAEAYNDSELYDLIPVKEKSSPKTRRKFIQDNMASYHDYREVPPSPRTQRPRLNLKSQYYTESEDNVDFVRYQNRRISPNRHNKYQDPVETIEENYSLQMRNAKKNKQRQKLPAKPEPPHQEIGTMSSLQYPHHFDIAQNNTTVDNALNNTHESGSSTDKTDRALYEIKDILQSFLQEIKKESSSSDKSEVSTKLADNSVSNPNPQVNAGVMPNSGHNFNYSAPQCSSGPTPYIMPPFPNACCYPVVPMYSMNCMQNGFVMPSQSFTCGCSKTGNSTDKANNTTGSETFAAETDELIKEIYKFVAQSPTFPRKQDANVMIRNQPSDAFENRVYTTRSAGGSTKMSKHDVKVGTKQMKCFSKSCEAIASRMVTDTYYTETNPTTYTDSIMENISLEATATTSFVTELSTERSEKHKVRINGHTASKMSPPNTKFGKVLQSFGLFKKKKDAIAEMNESESTIDVEITKKPPFRQEVTNYMMTNQVYDRPPPVPQDYRQPHYPYDHRPPYNPAMHNYSPPPNDPYYDPRMHQQEPLKGGGPHYHPGYPTAPPYSNYENFNQMQPQVPLCLKEIEVKSMGTQSERKMSFFRKIKQKMQPPNGPDGARNFATQTKLGNNNLKLGKADKPGLWKSWQAKALEGRDDPLAYSYKQQQRLATGDTKMRNAMLKKMFYKRNPFSPRNLIVRTLLGKDKSSFGNPPATYRARLFM